MLVGILATPETEVLIRKLDPVMDLRREDFNHDNVFVFSPFENEANQFVPMNVYLDNYTLAQDTLKLIAMLREI